MNPIELLQQKKQHLDRLTNQSGSKGEQSLLADNTNWLPRPKGKGLKVLLAELNAQGLDIKGSSFDAIELPVGETLNFEDASQVKRLLPTMLFIEIKTASQGRVKPNFEGFFFSLTESEIETSEILGARHKVAFFNSITKELLMTSVPEILARKKSSTWSLSVQL